MSGPNGIIVFGANGSGKTTLGRELARILGFKHMDHEDYAFLESEIPYARPRPHDACVRLMLSDIEKHGSFVLSSVTGNFGDKITQYYDLAVYMSAPRELRVKRIERRANNQYGDRVQKGGDMYEQQLIFAGFAGSRPLDKIERWAGTLTCLVICVDGAEDWRVNAARITEKFRVLRGIAIED